MSRPPFDPSAQSLLPPPRFEDEVIDEHSRTETVLVVDDNETIRQLIAQPLRNAGYRALEAGDGVVALDLLNTHDEVHLVLLDVRMPEVDGIEVCTEIRRRWDSLSLPVIFVTGLSDREARVWCRAVGGDEFLTKPMDETELLIRVDNLLKLRRYHRRIVEHNEYLEALAAQRGQQAEVAIAEALRKGVAMKQSIEEIRTKLAAAVETLGELTMEVAAEEATARRLVETVEALDEVHAVMARFEP